MAQTKEQILTDQKFLAMAKQIKNLQDQINRLLTLLDSVEFKSIETLLKKVEMLINLMEYQYQKIENHKVF